MLSVREEPSSHVKRKLRVEDARLITGTGMYADDLNSKRTAHAFILRSPYAHAKIRNIDLRVARSLRGVIDILTGSDAVAYTRPLPQAFDIQISDYCLAAGEVVYVGQPVVAVVAESKYIAEDAASLIEVEYEPLTHVLDAKEAAQAKGVSSHKSLESSLVFHRTLSYGEVKEAFENSDLEISDSFVFESYSAMPLETYAVAAEYNKATGMLLVHDNCQMPVHAISTLAHSLSIPSNRIRIIEQDIGGGFGVKTMTPSYDVLISLLAMRVDLPVKWVESRTEHMMASSHGTRRQYEVRAAVKKTGEILGVKVRAFEDAGAFLRRPGQTALVSCLRAFSGPYRFRAFEYDMNMVLTNKCPAGPSRGNGKNHHAFLLERLIERIASALKLDSFQVRLLNFIRPDEFPYLSANGCLYDSGNYAGAMSRVLDMIKYHGFREEQARLRNEGRFVGIGFALTLDPAASNMSQEGLFYAETKRWGTSETASIHVDAWGNATVALSSAPQGQGHETIAASIVAEILGLSTERVTVLTGFDSARNIGTPTSGTYSSRFAPIGASAVVLAAEEIKKKLLRVASLLLHVPSEDLFLENGRIKNRSDERSSLSLEQVASTVYSGTFDKVTLNERSLDSVMTFSYPFGRNEAEAKTNLASTYAYQAHSVVIEVDIETGNVKILRYAIVDDSGKSLNRMIVEGQVHGGACNGISAALYEKFQYDRDGQLSTSTFNDYLATTAVEIPDLEIELIENKSPFTPTGAKGVGESGALGPQPAIMNAIEDALRPYGVKIEESNVSPQMILDKIRPKRRT